MLVKSFFIAGYLVDDLKNEYQFDHVVDIENKDFSSMVSVYELIKGKVKDDFGRKCKIVVKKFNEV